MRLYSSRLLCQCLDMYFTFALAAVGFLLFAVGATGINFCNGLCLCVFAAMEKKENQKEKECEREREWENFRASPCSPCHRGSKNYR